MSEMYTERLLDHVRHPRHKGLLAAEDPAAPGQLLAAEEYNPLCGDRVTFQVRLVDGLVAEARFDGRGCALCLGAASILTDVVQDRPLDDLRAMHRDTFLAELQSEIRPARLRCVLLPWVAFRRAVFGEEEA
jgi:nitrogen fixation protein NifU and related proteins